MPTLEQIATERIHPGDPSADAEDAWGTTQILKSNGTFLGGKEVDILSVDMENGTHKYQVRETVVVFTAGNDKDIYE